MTELLTQEERDAQAKEKDGGLCYCGQKATGAWGLQVGHYNPFKYTPKMPYCSRCISDMIDGLSIVVKDLKKIRNVYRRSEGRPEVNY
jgi:hypothetical protein